jgi:hypothetical protein
VQAVADEREPLVIERDGEPIVVLVTPEQWGALEAALQRAWQRIEALRAHNVGLDPDEVLAVVTTEVEAARRERYDQEQATDRGH